MEIPVLTAAWSWLGGCVAAVSLLCLCFSFMFQCRHWPAETYIAARWNSRTWAVDENVIRICECHVWRLPHYALPHEANLLCFRTYFWTSPTRHLFLQHAFPFLHNLLYSFYSIAFNIFLLRLYTWCHAVLEEKHVFLFSCFSRYDDAYIAMNWLLCKTKQNALCSGYW